MKIIEQYYEIEQFPVHPLLIIEKAGRTCYKSESKITHESAEKFVKKILDSGHHSVIEHVSASVRFITDRGVTHEMVRHRIASYSQESTRYCNYSKDKFGNELTFILPVWFVPMGRLAEYKGSKQLWYDACLRAGFSYLNLLKNGQTAQQARCVLPNSLKTEIVMTCNLREWRHFFTLRTSARAHPQMRELVQPLLKEFQERIPVIFDGINQKENKNENK